MRFAFAEEHRHVIPVNRVCEIMGVSPCGYRAWYSRPACRRQRIDMVLLAHIPEQFRLSLDGYGRPRITEELKELGLEVGYRRAGWPMSENGIEVNRYKKFKATTDSTHASNIASNLLKRDLAIRALNIAIALQRPPKGCVHHTDRDSQYCSHDYQ